MILHPFMHHGGRGGCLSNSECSSPSACVLVCGRKPSGARVRIHAFHRLGYTCSHVFCSFDVTVNWISACWCEEHSKFRDADFWSYRLNLLPQCSVSLCHHPTSDPRISGTSVCVGKPSAHSLCFCVGPCVGACWARTGHVSFPVSSLVFGGVSLLF